MARAWQAIQEKMCSYVTRASAFSFKIDAGPELPSIDWLRSIPPGMGIGPEAPGVKQGTSLIREASRLRGQVALVKYQLVDAMAASSGTGAAEEQVGDRPGLTSPVKFQI